MNRKLSSLMLVASMFVAANSYASLSRVAVMGSQPSFAGGNDTNVNLNDLVVPGALWYDDDYNVFLNPAVVNEYKNFVTVSKGGNQSGGAQAVGQGGFFKTIFDNFVYGVYVNRNADAAANQPGANFSTLTTLNNAKNPLRPVEFIVGGDMGVKWGVKLAWAYNQDEVTNTALNGTQMKEYQTVAKYWRLDAGAQFMGFEPFVGFNWSSSFENTLTAEKENLTQFNLGLRYRYENWTPYLLWSQQQDNVLFVSAAAAGLPAGTLNTNVGTNIKVIAAGVGHDTKLADGVHVYKNIGFWRAYITDTTGAFGASDWTQTVIPLNAAIEGEALSWLVLRAGLTYDLVNNSNRKVGTSITNTERDFSNNGTLKFRIGSTFKFGKFGIDTAFGNGSASAATAAGLDNQSIGFDSQTFALVTANYRW